MKRFCKRDWSVIVAGCAGVLLSGLGGCAYQDQNMGNPVARRFTWFSYVAGDDIRAQCTAGAADRYRLVYNGFWHEQVRAYDLGAPGQPALLKQRVLQEGATVQFFRTSDVLEPWRGATAETTLSGDDYNRLMAALAASGLWAPPPVGQLLPSDGYYWTAVGCRDGQFVYNAWLYPDERFRALAFPKVLMSVDRTGVALHDPDPETQILHYDEKTLQNERWYIQVKEGGLSTGSL